MSYNISTHSVLNPPSFTPVEKEEDMKTAYLANKEASVIYVSYLMKMNMSALGDTVNHCGYGSTGNFN